MEKWTQLKGWSVAWRQRETMQAWYPAEIPDDENTSKMLGQPCAITYKWPKQGKKYGHSRLIFYSHVRWARHFVAIVWGSGGESPQGAPGRPDKGSALVIASIAQQSDVEGSTAPSELKGYVFQTFLFYIIRAKYYLLKMLIANWANLQGVMHKLHKYSWRV